ncbi:MAG TPA: hypothetical protein VFA18_00375, partial [Gemmataceae bacterium]|nr:hypothetical protein [Gemmataceae bacterium]
MNRRIIHVCLLATVALAASLCFATAANAGPKGAKSPFAAQLHELRGIRAVLQQADRDYKGHRVAAIRQINVAIRTLRSAKVARKGHSGKGQKGNGEPQGLSDAQLKEAIAGLVAVRNQLKGMPGPRPAKAVA